VAGAGGSRAIVVTIVHDEHEVEVARVDAVRPDLVLVDALMRLQLAATRRGWSVRLRDVPDELRALLELAGLGEVLDLALEALGEPELGEQRGEEEVVQPGDPPG
jgi:ABC-type transporter Mla MlaB component